MKRKGACTAYYRYPVELVWKALGFGSENTTVDPMSEEEYSSREPGPGMVFTRSLEVTQNEVFAFQMKTQAFLADWRIEMKSIGACETKVVFRCEMEFRGPRALLLSIVTNMRREVRAFARDLGKKLEEQNKKIRK